MAKLGTYIPVAEPTSGHVPRGMITIAHVLRPATPASVPGTFISVNLIGSPRATVRCLPGIQETDVAKGGGGQCGNTVHACVCTSVYIGGSLILGVAYI